MTCFVESPNAEQFIADTALLSFNGSAAFTPNVVTASSMLEGIDVSRYTASSDGLTISNGRPGVTLSISDYQASDGYIEFGCHGLYSSLIPSAVIISSQAQRLARELYNVLLSDLVGFYNLINLDPPSSLVVTLSQTNNCSSNTLISWSTPSSDRSITSLFVYRDGTLIYNALNTTNQYTDNTQLNINTVYEYSVVAISCAGSSTAGVMSVSIGGEITCLLLLLFCLQIHFLGFSLTNNPPIFHNYDDTSSILYIDWVNNNN